MIDHITFSSTSDTSSMSFNFPKEKIEKERSQNSFRTISKYLKSNLRKGVLATSKKSITYNERLHFINEQLTSLYSQQTTNHTTTYKFVEGKGFVSEMFTGKVTQNEFERYGRDIDRRFDNVDKELNEVKSSVNTIKTDMVTTENLTSTLFKSLWSKISAALIGLSVIITFINQIIELVRKFK